MPSNLEVEMLQRLKVVSDHLLKRAVAILGRVLAGRRVSEGVIVRKYGYQGRKGEELMPAREAQSTLEARSDEV